MAEKKKQNHKHYPILLVLLFVMIVLLGIGMIIYPLFASWYAEQTRSTVQSEYEEVIKQIDTAELDAARAAAHQYNKDLFDGLVDVLDPKGAGYYDQLNIGGKEIMGYIEIPKLELYLPIYHGIDTTAMANGCGHMPQSSLPVGGENTHSVISAHSGMATPMFSDLDKLIEGDIFFLHILDETLTYEVRTVSTTVPDDIEVIKIQSGKDLCSLITCWPFGINTHRLVVTGQRIETPEEEDLVKIISSGEEEDTSNAHELWMNRYFTGIIIGVGAAFLIIMILFIAKRSKDKKEVEAQKQASADTDADSAAGE